MTAALLQLTHVAKSFGAVRARKDVSFDQRADAPGQPGGLPDISRGLSASDIPGTPSKTNLTPEGWQNRAPIPCRRHTIAHLGHPSGVREICLSGYRGCGRCGTRLQASLSELLWLGFTLQLRSSSSPKSPNPSARCARERMCRST